jgi:DNA invertase Pin-like site-specific DNA recombinase
VIHIKYGYARCSTNQDKQDLERQVKELEKKGADEIRKEYVSGAKKDKPEFNKIYAEIQQGDTLAVTEVSRLSRNLHELCHIAERMENIKGRLECGNIVLDYTEEKTDPVHLAMYQIMGVFAELERGMTVERINSGLKNAKEKGKSIGRPRTTSENISERVKTLLPQYLEGKMNKKEYAEAAGVSKVTLYKYLGILGIKENMPYKTRPVVTKEIIPERIKRLYRKYERANGGMSITEMARRAKITRKTCRKYIDILREPETEE